MTARRALALSLAAAAAVLAAVVGPGASPAAADSLTIRRVDTTGFPSVKVDILVNGQSPDPSTFNVLEDKRYVRPDSVTRTSRDDLPTGIALVVDTSGSMLQNGKMDQAKAAARELVQQKAPSDEVAVVAFSDRVAVLQNFTSDTAALVRTIDSLTAAGETALYDGVRLGAGLFATRPELQANLVLISDGKDTASQQGYDAARATVARAKALVFAVGLAGGADFDRQTLEDLANFSKGSYVETSDPQQLRALLGRVQRNLSNQYQIVYTSKAKEPFDVMVTVGQLQASANKVPVDQVLTGQAVAPKVYRPPASPGPLRNESGALVVAGLVFLTVVLAAGAVGLLVLRSPSALEGALEAYTIAPEAAADHDDGGRSRGGIAGNDLVKRAVAATEDIARSRGFLGKVERRLEQANVRLRAGEVMFFAAVAVVVVTALAAVLVPPLLALLVMIIAAGLPFAVLSTMASLRRRKFTSQLPDMLQLLSGTLRAGYSLLQGLDAVAQEVEEPMGGELRRVLVEAQLGRELEEALGECAQRMESADFEWAVMAIGIQREVGGNLAELLDTVAETMLERERLRRDVKALTAEGRMSAIVLGGLPPGLGLVMWVLNPEYVGRLFTDVAGNILLGVAVLVALFGFWWMKKIIEIEI